MSKNEEVTTYLCLDVEQYSHVTRAAARDDNWDRDDTSSTWDVSGIHLSTDDKYRSVPNYLDAKEGDLIWVVYAVYSTGDSFGHDEDGSFEFINVFSNEKDARECAKTLLKTESKNPSYKLSNGKSVSLGYVPWSGYFETLSYIEYECFRVGSGQARRLYAH